VFIWPDIEPNLDKGRGAAGAAHQAIACSVVLSSMGVLCETERLQEAHASSTILFSKC